jgi:trk system potassium uptake protein TrkA
MEQDGYEVSIIDSDPRSFDRLPETFRGRTILGTGIDVDVLKSAGIENTDAFAAVTNFDNTNIMACEVAKEIFGIDKVLARIYDPGRESFYHELGLETVCPTTLVSRAAYDILSPKGSAQPQPAPLAVEAADSEPPSGVTAQTQLPAAPTAAAVPHVPQSVPERAPQPQQPQPQPQAAEANKPQPNGRGLRGLFRP